MSKKDVTSIPELKQSPLLNTTLSLISLQLVSRLFSFSLNQLLLRSTTPQALGVATLSLEVIRDTSLFFLREGLRRAVVRSRSSPTRGKQSKLIQRALLLPTLLSPLVVPLFLLYSFYPPSPPPPHFNLTLILYSLSAIIELFSEPYYLQTLQNWESATSHRVRVEGVAVGVKSIFTLLTILIGGERWALVSYGVGQVFYAFTLLVGLGRLGEKVDWLKMKLVKDGTGEMFDKELKELSVALTKQSIIKQVLTEGDKIVVGRLSKVDDQGGYAIALNYGSLIARILFQPLEESSRLFFSRSLSSSLPSPSQLLCTSSHLSLLLTLHTHLSLIFILLCPSYTSPLLHHLLGSRWSSTASSLLGDYCVYLPFMAINGILEAFFQSVANEKELSWGNWAMGLSMGMAGLHLFSMSYLGMGKGGEVIWANCTNLAVRIAFCGWFVRRYYVRKVESLRLASASTGKGKGKGPAASSSVVTFKAEEEEAIWRNLGWRTWTPSPGTFGTFYISWRAVTWSEKRFDWKTFDGLVRHVGVGAICGIACLIVSGMAQRDKIRALKSRQAAKFD